ncbi:unnamed protein product, partial [Amoebophrya sp. A25]
GGSAEIFGLQSEAGKALNGSRVKVFNIVGDGRVQVKINGKDLKKIIKVENLKEVTSSCEQVVNSKVMVATSSAASDIKSSSELSIG